MKLRRALGVKMHISTTKVHFSTLVEICPGLSRLRSIMLKKRLGISSHFFLSERPYVQLHSVPLHPVGPLVQSCYGKKNVSYKDLETTSEALWYSLKISCLSTKLLQPYLEYWHECSLRFRCRLLFPFY